MKIIGLGHYSRTGKDTLANMIVDDVRSFGLTAKKVPLAWKLKQVCYELYSWAGMQPPEYYDTPSGEQFRDVMLLELGMTPVEVWVAMGTPAIRDNVYDRTWIDYVLKTDHAVDVLLVPDIRFPNEIDDFREAGAVLGKVVRAGYGPRQTLADQALVGYDNWDLWLGGTMQDLANQAKGLAIWASGGGLFPVNSEDNAVYPALEAMKAMEDQHGISHIQS
jgi:hypothetical protein